MSDKFSIFKSAHEFKGFGRNAFAYVRRIDHAEMKASFPEIKDVPSDIDVWGLFAADGVPLAISDHEAALIDDAHERELMPLSRH